MSWFSFYLIEGLSAQKDNIAIVFNSSNEDVWKTY